MKPANKDSSTDKTPNADMQAEDAGTADSGDGASGNEVDSAMKQTGKTDAERGEEQADENRVDQGNQQR